MKKILTSLVILSLVFTVASSAMAQGRIQDPAKLQDLGKKMIDKRVGAINKYNGFLSKTKNIPVDTLSKVQGELTRVSEELSNLKSQILGTSDVAELQNLVKSIVNNYRVYQVFLPQSAGFVALDRLLTFQFKLVDLSNKIGQKATDLEGQGKDVTAIRELVQKAGQSLNTAGEQITLASSKFSAMTISDPEGSRTLKTEGRTALASVRQSFSEARVSLRDAASKIKALIK